MGDIVDLYQGNKMKTKYKHIWFENVSNAYPKRKTQTWVCWNNSGQILGDVEWNCRWRQYWFISDERMGYSISCLNDIAHFVEQLMEERRNAKEKKR